MKFLNRKLSFEVLAQREKRWTIDCVCDTEDQAVATARKLIASGKIQAARIVQYRTVPLTGFTTSRVILEEQAPVMAEKPMTLKDPQGETVFVCVGVADLYEPTSRRMMAQIMRDYFVKMQITPTELLHGWTHVKKLQDNGTVQMGAVHRAGSAQAKVTNGDVKARINRLNELIEEAARRTRDFAVERKKLPHYDGSDLGEYSELLRQRVGDEAHLYTLRSMLSAWLYDNRSLAAKLEILVALGKEGLPQQACDELDGVIADILCFGEVIQDLFGAQANMGKFLLTLTDLLQGRPLVVAGPPNPLLQDVAAKLHAGLLPQAREVLLDRLLREIASDKPLDRNDPENEARLLERLAEKVRDEAGEVLGGERTEKALAGRRLRARQEALRKMGLHTIADNLRAGDA